MWKIDYNELKAIATKLFTNELWTINLDGLSTAKKRLVKFIKLTRIVFTEFAEKSMGFQCVALSYFGALAVVPFAAFIFAIGDGIGMSDKISSLLHMLIPTNPEFIDTILEKATNIISTAQAGGVGIISALMFIWTVIWLMFQVERVFNNVWDLRKIPRKMYKRFGFYIGMLILSPFVVSIFGLGIALYSNFTSIIGIHVHIKDMSVIVKILGWVVFYVFTVLIVSVMYKYIPAADVKYRNAFWASLVASFVFVLFQYLYLQTQVFVTRLNGVYGAMAAIPLFLIWMNYSWQIIIYGEQLSYGLQYIDTYNIPEGRLKDFTPRRDLFWEEFKDNFQE